VRLVLVYKRNQSLPEPINRSKAMLKLNNLERKNQKIVDFLKYNRLGGIFINPLIH